MRNCLTCAWRGPARTPQINKDQQYAASCDYPLPTNCMLSLHEHDVNRHINLATITLGSEYYHPAHTARECVTWKDQNDDAG